MSDDDKRPEASAGQPGDSVTTTPAEPTDDVVASRHRLTVGDRTLDYTATAGRVVLREEVHNGGPGSSSVWLHLGLLGPRRGVDGGRRGPAAAAVRAGRQPAVPARDRRPRLHRPGLDRLLLGRRGRQARPLHVGYGYFDGATPHFAAEDALAHLRIPEELRANIEHRHYEAGHMTYVDEASRLRQSEDLADFVTRATAG